MTKVYNKKALKTVQN